MADASIADGAVLGDYLTEPLVVGEPDVAGPLAVFPIFGAPCTQRFLSFRQAAREGWVEIREVPSAASVGDLVVVNLGDVPALLYEGEEFLGGRQNRSLDVAVLVAAGTTLPVPVTCLEEGRWDASRHRDAFVASPQSVDPELRRAKSREAYRRHGLGLRPQADQGEVWDEVAALLGRHRSRSPTRAMSDVYEERRRELVRLAGSVRLHDHQIGTLVAIGGRFRVLDLVGRPEVFGELHGPLVQGYTLDALGERSEEPAPLVDRAQEFVSHVVRTEAETSEALGLGQGLRFSADGVIGSALVNEGELVQLTAFPGEGAARKS